MVRNKMVPLVRKNGVAKISSLDPLSTPPLKRGALVIKEALSSLPMSPGVYKMVSHDESVLYVGKARQLKKRVESYTRLHKLTIRLQRMVAQVKKVDVILTHTETEALLLENNLIKKLHPPYNILLKDDKSFGYIQITQHDFPALLKYRGKIDKQAAYYGPFASAQAINSTLHILYKTFKLRSCSDSVFYNRKRPCLQYHIKQCSAPCVNPMIQESYIQNVQDLKSFLSSQNHDLLEQFSRKMQEASEKLEFEQAAKYRDQIHFLSKIQQQQGIHVQEIQDADVIALAQASHLSCIYIFFFRNGYNFGGSHFFIQHQHDDKPDCIMAAFMMQFYQDHTPAPLLLTSHSPEDLPLITEALIQKSNHKITIISPQKGMKRKVLMQAEVNAKEALKRKTIERKSWEICLEQLQLHFHLPKIPQRIEVYDNSHLFGTDAYGAMIVFSKDGFDTKAYRKFKISSASPKGGGGDDYAMMREVLSRRFHAESQGQVIHEPDLLIIDGGKGQLSAVRQILETLNVRVPVIAMAKGPDRHAGKEIFHLAHHPPIQFPTNDPTLYFLQQLRDEAHRFVITAHRKKRLRNIQKSTLDNIDGVGPQRKRALLGHFGSLHNVSRAGLDDLLCVKGIDKNLARVIYNYFHH